VLLEALESVTQYHKNAKIFLDMQELEMCIHGCSQRAACVRISRLKKNQRSLDLSKYKIIGSRGTGKVIIEIRKSLEYVLGLSGPIPTTLRYALINIALRAAAGDPNLLSEAAAWRETLSPTTRNSLLKGYEGFVAAPVMEETPSASITFVSDSQDTKMLDLARKCAWDAIETSRARIREKEAELTAHERRLNLREQQLCRREDAWKGAAPERAEELHSRTSEAKATLEEVEDSAQRPPPAMTRRVFLRAFRAAGKGTLFQDSIVLPCHACKEPRAAVFSCGIQAGPTPFVVCASCCDLVEPEQAWLPRPKFERERVGCFVRQAGLQMQTLCRGCLSEIRLDHYHRAHNLSDHHGGPCVMENLRATCAECNIVSKTQIFDEYAAGERELTSVEDLPPLMELGMADTILDFLFGLTLVPPPSL
jgi:hypothetical protein